MGIVAFLPGHEFAHDARDLVDLVVGVEVVRRQANDLRQAASVLIEASRRRQTHRTVDAPRRELFANVKRFLAVDGEGDDAAADVTTVVQMMRDRIWNLHVEDLPGRKHYHMIPGEGTFDWPTLKTALESIGYDRFLTVELLAAEGFDDHLPATGVAVHLIDGDDATRTQTPLVGVAPYDDLLTVGETFTGAGWRVAVGADWRTTIEPAEDAPTVSG